MHKPGFALAMLALCAGATCAQQTPPPAAQAPASQVHPVTQKPGSDGAYFVGPDVTAPSLVRVMAPGYPFDVSAKKELLLSVLTMIVGVNGRATNIEVVRSVGEDFDASAINAVKLCQFAPGMLNGKPVPVRIDVETPFRSSGVQAVPRVVIAEEDWSPPDWTANGKKRPKYTAPIPIHTAIADFSDPDTRRPYPAVAVVTVLVNTEGVPVEARVIKGQGFGMDEKAVAAVMKYRFQPAVDKGKVIAARRNIEVKFSLF